MKIKLIPPLIVALIGSVSSAQAASYLVGPTDFTLTASTAVGVSPYQNLADIADGITNSDTVYNGAVFSPTFPATFTFTFSTVSDLSAFSLFTQVGASGAQGIKDFSVDFYDASGGSLGSISGQALNAGNNWQEWTFAEIIGVKSAVLTVTSRLLTSNDPEISEVRFYGTPQIPEASTSLLALSGGMTALLRLRRR